jgi:hypothetical protein
MTNLVRLPSATSAQSRRYLLRDSVRPGDVLLSMGTGLDSKAIAVATGGEFSHAALFHNDSTLFEADESGIGFTFLPLIVGTVDGQEARWLELPDYYSSPVVVLRHPHLAKYDIKEFEQAFRRVTTKFYAEPYSKLERLVDASRLPERVRPVFRRALRLRDRRRASAIQAGSFCSELIGHAFNELGLSLFDVPVSPCQISPAVLARQGTHLRPVKDALVASDVVARAEIRDVVAELGEALPNRKEILSNAVKAKTVAAVNMALAEQIQRAVDTASRQSRTTFVELVSSICDNLFRELSSTGQSGDSDGDERILTDMERLMEAYPLALGLFDDLAQCDASNVQALVAIYAIPLLSARRALRRALSKRRGTSESPGRSTSPSKLRRLVIEYKNLERRSSETAASLYNTYMPAIAAAKKAAIPIIVAHAVVRVPHALIEGQPEGWWQLEESRRVEFLGNVLLELSQRDKQVSEALAGVEVFATSIQASFPNPPGTMCLRVSGPCSSDDIVFITDVLVQTYLRDAGRREVARKREIVERDRRAKEIADAFVAWAMQLDKMPTKDDVRQKVVEAIKKPDVNLAVGDDVAPVETAIDINKYIIKEATLGECTTA